MDLLSEPPKGRGQTLQPLVQILNLQQNSFAQNLGGLKEYFSPTGFIPICPAFMNYINSDTIGGIWQKEN